MTSEEEEKAFWMDGDMYLCLQMEEAMATPYQPVLTEKQPWVEEL